MSELPAYTLVPPTWVIKRDGRHEPFEADRIARALFAVSESLGKPNAFLARELTDSIVHFLAADTEGTTPTTTQIAETVVKVVRELGQPGLAQAFAEQRKSPTRAKPTPPTIPEPEPAPTASTVVLPTGSWPEVQQTCQQHFTLQQVFARDLVSTHYAGLIVLTGLAAPLQLSSCVVPGHKPDEVLAQLADLREVVGGQLVFDGPDYGLAQVHDPESVCARYVHDLHLGLALAQRTAVINLNSATPPAWADELAVGPLFAQVTRGSTTDQRGRLSTLLAETLLACTNRCRLDWHLSPDDFLPAQRAILLELVRRVLLGQPITFVFDRPKRPHALAEGLTRQHPASLLAVGLNLTQLLEQTGAQGDFELFLQKLASLARLALSAAKQKRDFLRKQQKHPALSRGFLLDRARLMVTPLDLEATVRAFSGTGLCAGGTASELAKKLLLRLDDVLTREGARSQLSCCVDGPIDFALQTHVGTTHLAGVTCWDEQATAKVQLRTSGSLQAGLGVGTGAWLLSEKELNSPETIADWLAWAAQHTELVRCCLLRAGTKPKQLLWSGT